MIKFLVVLFICSLILYAFFTFILFVFDVFRWHDREERVNIIPSAPEPDSEAELDGAEEVSSDVGSDEYNSSAFSVPWGQS